MRVLVSGATGLVGRYIVEDLLASGHVPVVAGRRQPPKGLFSADVAYRPLSLDAADACPSTFEGIEGFVHAAFHHEAGRYRGGEGHDPDLFRRRNLDGSVALFEAARAAGVQRCVFLSSRAVYDGLPAGEALLEDLSLAPTSLYGEVKLAAEQALEEIGANDFCGASLRLTGVYGHLRPNKWDQLIMDYLAGLPIAARAGSEVHGRDAARAVRLLLDRHRDSVAGRRFNVSDIVTDTREILTYVRAETGCPHDLPDPADRASVAVMPTSRILALGWGPGGRPQLEKTVRHLARRISRRTPKTSRVVRSSPGAAFLRPGRLRRQRR